MYQNNFLIIISNSELKLVETFVRKMIIIIIIFIKYSFIFNTILQNYFIIIFSFSINYPLYNTY